MKDYKKIKLLILDCDGVLTDGKIIYDDNRNEIRNFSAKDGLGIKLLPFANIQVAVISGKKSEILARRCEDLGIRHVFQKVRNKLKTAEELIEQLNLNWENVAFMGDDWNDFPIVKRAYITSAPADAFEDFQKKVDFVTRRNGGEGAVREFIEHILKEQGVYDKTVEKLVAHLENN